MIMVWFFTICQVASRQIYKKATDEDCTEKRKSAVADLTFIGGLYPV